MDGESFGRLNELRRRFYPPERNLVPAHITLFHQLPGDHDREIKALLRGFAAGQPVIDVEVTDVKAFGEGVGLSLRSPQLLSVRNQLAGEWSQWLGAQDRAG